VSAGQDVLDVAAGNGNVAATAAREGAHVVASDFAPAQVDRGRARTEAEGLDVEWVVADVEELPFDDGSFDAVLSVFGAQFGHRPERVASELFRVLRPGGTVGLSCWPQRGFQHELFDVINSYGPPAPEGVPNPRMWGEEEVIRERLGPHAGSVSVEPRTLRWEFGSFAEMGELFQRSGPRALEQVPEDRLPDLMRDAQEVVDRWNEATDGTVRLDAEYSLVVARKRG
jgi:SAM-dependent methyltransferase